MRNCFYTSLQPLDFFQMLELLIRFHVSAKSAPPICDPFTALHFLSFSVIYVSTSNNANALYVSTSNIANACFAFSVTLPICCLTKVSQLRNVPGAHWQACHWRGGNQSWVSYAFRAQQPHSCESSLIPSRHSFVHLHVLIRLFTTDSASCSFHRQPLLIPC